MLAGAHDTTGRRNARLLALKGVRTRHSGPLSVAWSEDVEVAGSGDLTVWVDGFLLGGADAATVLAAWPDGATAALASLRGAFTILVWDERRAEATLANDQMALRSCVVHRSGPATTWASDVVTLRAILPTTPPPDEAVLSLWMAPLNPQGHATMLAGVERVGAGRVATVSARGWSRRRYWDPPYRPPARQTFHEESETLRARLDAAVALRMDPDRPTAVMLSGGLDSTVVTAVAAAGHGADALRAYSATFPEWPWSDETDRIEAVRAHLELPGRTFAPRAQGGVRLAVDVVRAAGLPPGGPGGLVELPGLQQAARDGLRVVLDGQGGDEVLGLSPFLVADRLRAGDPIGALRLLHRVYDLRRPQGRSVGLRQGWAYGVAPLLGRRFARRRDRRALLLLAPLRPERVAALHAAYDPLAWRTHPGTPLWWQYQRHRLIDGREQGGLSAYLWERGLRLGLRSPAPLMDVDLVEHALAADPAVVWGNPDRRPARRAVAALLPRAARASAAKANIGPFYLSLLTGPDAPVVDGLLDARTARVRAWLDPAGLAAHVGRRPTAADPEAWGWATARWRMLGAELWLRWLEDADALEAIPAPEPAAD